LQLTSQLSAASTLYRSVVVHLLTSGANPGGGCNNTVAFCLLYTCSLNTIGELAISIIFGEGSPSYWFPSRAVADWVPTPATLLILTRTFNKSQINDTISHATSDDTKLMSQPTK